MKKIIFGVLIGIAGWTFYDVLNSSITDLLAWFGITNPYIKSFIILGGVVSLLILLGKSKMVKKILQ